MMTISSQRYLDKTIVAAKRADEDYTVTVSPVFALDGAAYRVVVDGHHSLEAARLAGVEPVYIEADAQMADTIALLARGRVEDYLEATYIDSPYYDVATGVEVW